MKNRFSIAWLCLVILVLGIVSACGGGDEESTTPALTTPGQTTTPVSTTPGQTTAPASTTPTSSTATVDELTELFSKWTGENPVKYDLTVSVTGQPTITGHIWQTRTKQRMEYVMEGEHIVMIYLLNEEIMYMYYPDQNMAMKMVLNTSQMAHGTMEGDMADVLDNHPVIAGTEDYDGKECLVVEFTSDEMSIKLWVWVDTGFPIRTEGTTPDGTLTVMEYTNISFANIPDSVFEIPEGVQIMEM
ncbi:MAG: hypothetical protein JW845_07530 [Dehalococcoidales bacterium]|nr:hypothetical protein [Dehalococcoidales bacterium]